MRSAGIRLYYPNRAGQQSGIKDGILLELGFDDTTPNRPVTISSWAYDAAPREPLEGEETHRIRVEPGFICKT